MHDIASAAGAHGVEPATTPAPPMRRLQDRVVLITGAAQGIGEACARRYAAEGATVAIGDIDLQRATAVAESIGGMAQACDHTDPAQCAAFVTAALERFGRIDALHNNAGLGWTGAFDALAPQKAQQVLHTLVLGPLYMTQAALPALRRCTVPGGAAMLFTSSGLGLHGRAMVSIYSAGKHAVLGLMRSLAMELGPEGIRVNAVCPGVVDTAMMRGTTGGWGSPQQVLEGFRAATPLRRVTTTQDVAASAAFLLSGDAQNLTGTALLVDGGAHEA